MSYNDMDAHQNPSFIDEKTAAGVIGPEILDDLVTCYEVAWEKYNELARRLAPAAHPRSIATFYREIVIEEVRQRIAIQPGVIVSERFDRFLVEVRGRLLIQFKKLGPDFTTSNIPTPTSVAFDLQYEMPGITLPRVTVGYRPNAFWTELEGVWLVFNIGRQNIWAHNLVTRTEDAPLSFPMPDEGAADREEREHQRRRDDRRGESEAS